MFPTSGKEYELGVGAWLRLLQKYVNRHLNVSPVAVSIHKSPVSAVGMICRRRFCSCSIIPCCGLNRQQSLIRGGRVKYRPRSEEHTSELQSLRHLVCRLL